MLLNAVGASLSAVVFVIAAVTKFTGGAWVALLLIALLVAHHLAHPPPLRLRPGRRSPSTRLIPLRRPIQACSRLPAPTAASDHARSCWPRRMRPGSARHLVVVPVGRLDLSSLRALAYAASLGQPVLAVHLSPGDEEAKRFALLARLGRPPAPPDRRVALPRADRATRPLHRGPPPPTIRLALTVVLPKLIVKHPWQQPLHNGTARRLACLATPAWSRDHPRCPFTCRPDHAGLVLHRFRGPRPGPPRHTRRTPRLTPSGKVHPNASATGNARPASLVR